MGAGTFVAPCFAYRNSASACQGSEQPGIGMGKVTDSHTRTILKVLPAILVCFYCSYYILGVIFVAALGVDWDLLGSLPFVWEDFGTTTDADSAAFACMIVNSFLLILYIYFSAKSTQMAW